MTKPMEPNETYKGIPIHLYQNDTMKKNEWGASIEWYGRMIDVDVEEWEKPTLENVVSAAHMLIDLMKDVEASGAVGPDGYLKKDWKPQE